MLLRLVLFISYFVVLFLFSRTVEYSATLIELIGFKLVCDLLPLQAWAWFKCTCEENDADRNAAFGSSVDNVDIHEQKTNDDDDDTLITHSEDTGSSLDDVKSIEHNVDFTSFANLREHVEDTKASVWLVIVQPAKMFLNKKREHKKLLETQQWNRLTEKLAHYGVRTGVYRCKVDPTLCVKHKVRRVSLLLTMPKGAHPKGKVKVEFYEFETDDIFSRAEQKAVYFWVREKLQSKVVTLENIDYSSNLPVCNLRQGSKNGNCPMLHLVYQSKQNMVPLFFATLSVRFTGRINFLHVRISDLNSEKLIVVGNSSLPLGSVKHPLVNYTYGKRKGENFRYTNIELFLRTLHPEVNDIFMFAMLIINMLCSLEFIIQKGGPLKRTLYLLWITTFANTALVFAWLPLMRLLQLPVAKPIIDISLKFLQVLMVSDVASMVREDLMNISEHVHIIAFGFVCYGILYGFLKYRISHGSLVPFRPLIWVNEDLVELQAMLHSLLSFQPSSLQYFRLEEGVERFLHRLSLPDLWLHPLFSEEFFFNLPVWKFCKHLQANKAIIYKTDSTTPKADITLSKLQFKKSRLDKEIEVSNNSSDESTEDGEKLLHDKKISCACLKEPFLPYLILSNECSICLESFSCGTEVKVLPCGHLFHIFCVGSWIRSGQNRRHLRCPLCRWPMFKRKKTN